MEARANQPAASRGGADRATLAVLAGVLAVSAAAIFIRLAHAPPLAVAFWRTAVAAVVVAVPLAWRRERLPRGRDLGLCVAAGLALGAHFALWITSLDLTSVAASVVLVCTQPVFVAVLAALFLRERPTPRQVSGILVALAGAVFIASRETGGRAGALGNVLALAGAVAVAIYVLLGRRLRASGVPVLAYAGVVYGTAAAGLLLACAALRVPLAGFSPATWGWLAAVALGPQVIGHTLLNWALGRVPAAVVSGSILAEPIVSTLLAWALLRERPGAPTLAGGAVVLVGLWLLLAARPPADPTSPRSRTPDLESGGAAP